MGKKSKLKKTFSKSKVSLKNIKSRKKSKEKKEKKKKEKKQKKKALEIDESSTESSSDSASQKTVYDICSDQQQLRPIYMFGACNYVPKNPDEYPKMLMECEQPDLFSEGVTLTNDECLMLDEHLKKAATFKSGEFLVTEDKRTKDESKLQRYRVLEKYNEGRFSALYLSRIEYFTDGETSSTAGKTVMVKTCLRRGGAARLRMIREVKALLAVMNQKDPKRILAMVSEGRVLGIPFLVFPAMDSNLEKMREEMSFKMSVASAFYIAQEMLVAVRSCHRVGIVHRDIKPTNFVLSNNLVHWMLIDFGEAFLDTKKAKISPPDGYTLPYLAVELHDAIKSPAITKKMYDMEMWFYTAISLIKPLPWQRVRSPDDVKQAKMDFWKDLTTSCVGYPEQVLKIAEYIRQGGSPSSTLSKLIEKGFEMFKPPANPYVPDWKQFRLGAGVTASPRQKTATNNTQSSAKQLRSAMLPSRYN